MKVTPHSIEEARYIEEMTRTTGWSILRGKLKTELRVSRMSLLIQSLNL